MARVLVVEDDTAIRHLIVEVLKDDGHELREAPDGLAALDSMREAVPDLVVLDLFMPRMDGHEFLNVSRMLPGCASTLVVVVSARDQLPVDRRVRAFLKKPFDPAVLSHAVRALLDEAKQPLPT